MSKKANPVSIGIFILVGAGLGLAGLVLFSSRNLFHPRQKHIVYFNTSLKGLNVGAPVKYRGVAIGSVAEVLIRHNQATNDFAMPVIISIDKKLAQSKSDEQLDIGSQARLDLLIQQGFRGELDAESLVTGVLYIALDVLSNAPPPQFHQLRPEYQEIPTTPSPIQQLLANLAHFDIAGLPQKLTALLGRLDTSLSELKVADINAGVTNLLGAANNFLATPDLTNSVAAIRRTLNDADVLLTRIDRRVDPLVNDLTNTLSHAQKTLADLRRGIQNLAGLIGPDASLRSDLRQTLEDLANASRAVADLAEFLQRNPNAVLTGRKQQKEKP